MRFITSVRLENPPLASSDELTNRSSFQQTSGSQGKGLRLVRGRLDFTRTLNDYCRPPPEEKTETEAHRQLDEH
jgi:hypothetical protein